MLMARKTSSNLMSKQSRKFLNNKFKNISTIYLECYTNEFELKSKENK